MLRSSLLTLAILVFSAGIVLAQDSTPVLVSPAQAQLNDQAVEAVAAGELDKGARLFQASLDLGPLNITYLNLGRTLAKLGRCAEATEAYAQTLKAPPVAKPSPLEVDAIVKRYQLELVNQCDGTVVVRCAPPQMEIQIDDGAPQTCPDAPLTLNPGAHNIIGSIGAAKVSTSVVVKGLTEITVDLHLDASASAPVVTETAPTPPPNLAGWVTTGAGAALLGTALLLDVLWIQPEVDRLETDSFASQSDFDALRNDIRGRQTANLVIVGVGAAVTLTGVVLMLWDGQAEPDSAAGWFVTPAGVHAQW